MLDARTGAAPTTHPRTILVRTREGRQIAVRANLSLRWDRMQPCAKCGGWQGLDHEGYVELRNQQLSELVPCNCD
jgi:hypothetical protein